jgi:hypothetical protein
MKNNIKKLFQNPVNKLFIGFILSIALVVGGIGCGSPKAESVEVGNIRDNNPDKPTLAISPDKVNDLITKYNRLTKSQFNYKYTQAELVSFPMQPGKYVYYLAVSAEVNDLKTGVSQSHYRVYCELSQKEGILYFIPDNFQQACSSNTCSNCELIMYQNGSFGCACNGDHLDNEDECSYEKSRILTKKQQKSDII